MANETLTPEIIFAVFQHRDARTSEIEAAMRDCRPRGHPFVFISTQNGALYVSAYWNNADLDGLGSWRTRHQGTDLDALCDQVLADVAAYAADMFGTEVERMALAIIQIKHRDGAVTDRALRMANFSQQAIEQIHERAALLANEMSDGKPFEVEFVGAGNHAEAV